MAGLLWAISAPVINLGLAKVRKAQIDRPALLFFGLTTALVCGFFGIWIASGFASPIGELGWYVVLGGVFTFPIGTGLYYLASAAYENRAAVASQYANVKPVLSIGAGVVLFGEILAGRDYAVVALIVSGVALMLVAAVRREVHVVPVLLGLALAFAWSAGEVFIRLAADGASNMHLTLGALFSALLITLPAAGLLALRRRAAGHRIGPVPASAMAPFAVHGLLSFAGAYYFFFQSIGNIGLSKTIMVTVWWPALALVFDIGRRMVERRPLGLSWPTSLGLAFFLAAGIVHVWAPQAL